MDDKKFICVNCGTKEDSSKLNNDKDGWNITCSYCNTIFDIDIKNYLVPNDTKVKIISTGETGIIWGNDADNAEEFENINYFFIADEDMHREVWFDSDIMIYLLRKDFEIIYI